MTAEEITALLEFLASEILLRGFSIPLDREPGTFEDNLMRLREACLKLAVAITTATEPIRSPRDNSSHRPT